MVAINKKKWIGTAIQYGPWIGKAFTSSGWIENRVNIYRLTSYNSDGTLVRSGLIKESATHPGETYVNESDLVGFEPCHSDLIQVFVFDGKGDYQVHWEKEQ